MYLYLRKYIYTKKIKDFFKKFDYKKITQKEGGLLLLFVFYFFVAFFFFSLSEAAVEEEIREGYDSSNSMFLSFADGIDYSREEVVFMDRDYIFASSTPYLVETRVFGSMGLSQERDSIFSYRVEKGDSLDSVAKKFDISVDTIKWANNLKSGKIEEGDELLILPTTGVMYYVERGDTIGEIAEMHKAKAEDIIDFNNIDEKKIIPGDRLIIPGGEPPPPPKITPITPKSSRTPSITSTGAFINPVPGGMITQGVHPYNAVDIYNPCGYPVVASASGVVTETGRGTWPAGNFIKIDHGTVVILYSHLERIMVSPGNRVSQGQQVGTVGNTGYTVGRTGCHLHFDVLSLRHRNPFAGYPVGSRP